MIEKTGTSTTDVCLFVEGIGQCILYEGFMQGEYQTVDLHFFSGKGDSYDR